MDTHELAWAAGFFDGEGSVFYRGRKRKELNLTVSQSDVRPLRRFHAAVFGIGSVRGPYAPKYANGKPYFVYSAGAHAQVQTVVALLWRFLSEPKREQAATALSEALPYVRTRFIRGSKGRAALSMAEADALRAEYDQLRVGRQRAPRGALDDLKQRYGLRSVNAISAIVAGRGYRKEDTHGT